MWFCVFSCLSTVLLTVIGMSRATHGLSCPHHSQDELSAPQLRWTVRTTVKMKLSIPQLKIAKQLPSSARDVASVCVCYMTQLDPLRAAVDPAQLAARL
jgi:hypothetical protein